MGKIITYLILLSLSVIIGMIIGIIFKPKDIYHGPNAKSQSKKIYLNKKTQKCFKFNIKVLNCPEQKTKLQKMMDSFKKIW